MIEERGLRVISITRNIPERKLTIVTEAMQNFPVSPGEQIIVLSESDIADMNIEYHRLFEKYRKTREELLRYKRTMKELKLLMETSE